MNNRMLKIIAVSVRVCGLLSIVLGLIWVVGSSITIVPDWEETLQDILRSVAISFVVFISLASIFLGIERSFRHKIVASKKRRIVSRFLVLFLILTGAQLLTFGHAYYIKSQKRESEKIEMLNKYGCYENPYHMKYKAFDIGGLACFSVLLMWLYIEFVSKVSESISRRVSKYEQPLSKQ
jgi:hypothetical protein